MITDSMEIRSVAPGIEVGVSLVQRADGSQTTVYSLAPPDRTGPHPTILLLHGSGADSVFTRSQTGIGVPLLFGPLCELQGRWRVHFVEKRGVCFRERRSPRGQVGERAVCRHTQVLADILEWVGF
jgi:pimeloyl-ACP methyl ester carboxylesterase